VSAGNEVHADRVGEQLGSFAPIQVLQRAASETPVYLVGGAVRDLILGAGSLDVDLDVAVEAPGEEVAALARRIDPGARVHDRFGTATVDVDGSLVDLAATRSEAYEHPGALPEVSWAGIDADLARRDFSINAMAIPLGGEARLLDPHRGLADLGEGVLRVLHSRSLVDDPTRALRAARYSARLDLEPEPETARLLRQSDLGTVSAERTEADLRRAASEPEPVAVLSLLVDWGLAEADLDLAEAALGVANRPEWAGIADRAGALLAAGAVRAGRFGPLEGGEGGREVAAADGSRPSELVASARGRSGAELVIGRALGAEWLDRYVSEWRHVRLEITGGDLLAAGVPEGPAVGRGLTAALAAKIDGEVQGRDEELGAAIDAARAFDEGLYPP
jgi:tRNA nucleotidyltransferase (CCA-adding enzyme)